MFVSYEFVQVKLPPVLERLETYHLKNSLESKHMSIPLFNVHISSDKALVAAQSNIFDILFIYTEM